jgi:hypothetical protein
MQTNMAVSNNAQHLSTQLLNEHLAATDLDVAAPPLLNLCRTLVWGWHISNPNLCT